MHQVIEVGDQIRGGSLLHLVWDKEQMACDMRWATPGKWFPLTVDDINVAHFVTDGIKQMRMKYGMSGTNVIALDGIRLSLIEQTYKIPSGSVLEVCLEKPTDTVMLNVITRGPVFDVINGVARTRVETQRLATDEHVYLAYSWLERSRDIKELSPLEQALHAVITRLS